MFKWFLYSSVWFSLLLIPQNYGNQKDIIICYMDNRHLYYLLKLWHLLVYIPAFEMSLLQVLQGRHHNINKVWQITTQEKGIQWPWIEHSPWPQAWQQWASESESTSCHTGVQWSCCGGGWPAIILSPINIVSGWISLYILNWISCMVRAAQMWGDGDIKYQ